MPVHNLSLRQGFTVIELLVVLAALALLMSVAAPRYVQHLDKTRDTALRQNLQNTREAIDQFYSDQGRYPEALEELVAKRYLRSIPEDPITQRVDTWVIVPPNTGGSKAQGKVYDIKSGAPGRSPEGSAYASW